MPKINVYLPDALAAAVKEAGVPVSPVCQHALATAVRKVTAARKAIALIRQPGFDPAAYPAVAERLADVMTARLTECFGLARAAAGSGPVGTAALLAGILSHGETLGLRLLRALDIDTDDLVAQLDEADLSDGETGPAPLAGATSPLAGLTRPSWLVVAAGLENTVELGHNYLGSEHIVLGLLTVTEGMAGPLLRGLGADPAAARKALASMLAGYTHGREMTLQAGGETLAKVMRRLDALEDQVATLGGVSG